MGRAHTLRDIAIGCLVVAVLAAIPFLLPSKAFQDFVIRCASMALFATSLNLLVGYTGLSSALFLAEDEVGALTYHQRELRILSLEVLRAHLNARDA